MARITADEARALLRHDPETGIITWRVSRPPVRAGDVAGNRHRKGCWTVMIGGANYAAHRLAWLYMTGDWPKAGIDHVNLDACDNRFSNLREANQSQNAENQKLRKNNTVGLKGVTRYKNKWVAQITTNFKNTYLGTFDCPAAAHLKYVVEAYRRFGEFARAS